MAWAVNRKVKHMVRAVHWLGRCGGIHLYQRCNPRFPRSQAVSIYIIGIHNAHGDEQIDCLHDVSTLIRERPRGSKVAILGDMNCDQLPTMS
eukprot:10416281-Alexandrium_andersonii.AAC.1